MAEHFKRGKYRDEDRVIGPSLDAIERSSDVLLQLSDHDSAKFFRLEDHQKNVGTGDVKHASLYLFSDVYNWLKVFWWTNIFKMRQITEGLVHSYNTDNFLTWLVLARSSLEYAAVNYYFVKKIKQFDIHGPNFKLSDIKGVEELLLQYTHGSRFNWKDLFEGNRENLKEKLTPTGSSSAVNVMTALKHLAKRDDRYRDVEIAYDMLSDFAHPNMASHASVIEMPVRGTNMHEVHMAVQPAAPRGEFIMVVSLPWVSTSVGTTVELLIEITPLLETWLNYLDGGQQVSLDFTK
jgi:hypothetical protein